MRNGQKRVMQAFLAGKPKKESAFSTSGSEVFSYGMLIAHRTLTGRVLYLLPPSQGGPAAVSSTTSEHVGACSYFVETTEAKKRAFKDKEKFAAEVQKDRKKRIEIRCEAEGQVIA